MTARKNIPLNYRYVHNGSTNYHMLPALVSMRDARRIIKLLSEGTTSQDSCVQNLTLDLSESAELDDNRILTCLYASHLKLAQAKFHACTQKRFYDFDYGQYPHQIKCLDTFVAGKCKDPLMQQIGAILWPGLYAKNKQNTK